MRILVALFFLSFPILSFGQSYQYIPMNLDTSSFWVHDYNLYQGFAPPNTTTEAEMISYVEKDTIINSKTYFKIKSYVSELRRNELQKNEAFLSRINYIREDTSLKKVFIYDTTNARDSLYIDFNLTSGDTLNSYPFPSFWGKYIIVDSVLIRNVSGTNRKITYYNHPGIGNLVNEEIEGVGMRFQFPFNFHGGEWGAPGFTCRCYSKGQMVQYLGNDRGGSTLFAQDSCYKKNSYIWPVSTRNFDKQEFLFNYYQNRIYVQNTKGINLTLSLFNMQGQKLWELESNSYQIEKDLENAPKGIYIISVQSSKGIDNRKILIR